MVAVINELMTGTSWDNQTMAVRSTQKKVADQFDSEVICCFITQNETMFEIHQ
jgi:hypothetical protein